MRRNILKKYNYDNFLSKFELKSLYINYDLKYLKSILYIDYEFFSTNLLS